FSLVSYDGLSFEGPFQQTFLGGGLSAHPIVLAGGEGLIHAAWQELWPGGGGTADATYEVSYDYGRSFPRHDLVWDNRVWPPFTFPALAVIPNATPCLVDATTRYTECR
ncbi:MAG: hypothetical protein AB1486_19605, partial [Planctomycetota bacterium]